jgi:two-component system response regulator QseB
MELLLVEDDSLLGAGLRAALAKAGFSVTWIKDGAAALQVHSAQEFDVIVLDIGLPRMNGLEVLRRLRAGGSQAPVLVLTAAESTRDKLQSFDCGADDFLPKTADMEELIAHIRALLRRAGRGSATLSAGPLRLHLDTHTVTRDGVPVPVSKREFSLLRALVEGVGRVLTRRQLEQSLYGSSTAVESNAVEVHIHNLRQKLGAATLKTVRGVGYTLAAQEA